MAGGTPQVLVGMLHVGEPSVPRVRGLITAQSGVDVELLEIAHLPEREAHARLYAAFDAADTRFDAVVKVDADMELIEPRLLHAIAVMFRRHSTLDHILLGVDDWFSGRRILGLTAWRRGVRWTSPPPELFTDLPTNTSRNELKVLDPGRPLVLHAADPTDAQAIRYGLHRGLKAVSTGKASRLERLRDVIEHAAHDPQRGRAVAVAAIALALEDGSAGRRMLADPDADDAARRALLERSADPHLMVETLQFLAALTGRSGPPPVDRSPEQSAAAIGGEDRVRGLSRRARGRLGRLIAQVRRTVASDAAGMSDMSVLREEFLSLLGSAPLPAGRSGAG